MAITLPFLLYSMCFCSSSIKVSGKIREMHQITRNGRLDMKQFLNNLFLIHLSILKMQLVFIDSKINF